MRLAIALTLVIAFPTMAAAQYVFQLRPSPYRILSGWEQSANSRGQSIERVTRAVTPVIDRTQAGVRPNSRDGGVTGSTPAPR
jgi:hypothetical protein